ncbi:GntR family transcriptional regulator [Rathayibacter festucae]|uniref:GntR family transcriptional regulator n=1 Tax=Rathayibacter festucae DSM 15932 TaxID=1328866 RepID=A0A3T0T1I3_9MICO|nr:GntR family transcriptional regulator [Rathayibacter festucae]AZZ52468.1 GntR family transcriptional regulator [Rathayibacter festucae DSM 15932]
MPTKSPAQTMSQRVYEELRTRILDGRLPAGEPIRERDLATELAVSRVPIREALPWLELAGLVTVRPRSTAVVSIVRRRDVEELYDIRSALEPLVARKAAEAVARGADASALTAVVADASAALAAGDLARFHSESGRIHGAIEAIAGNRLLITTMQPLDERSNRLNIANIQAEPGVRHDEHVRLAEAIAAGDAPLAVSVAHAHVEWGRARTVATLAHVPGFIDD